MSKENKIKKILYYTQKKLDNWYVDVKLDYGIIGEAKVTYDNSTDNFIVNYTEDGATVIWESGCWALDESIDYVFTIWMSTY